MTRLTALLLAGIATVGFASATHAADLIIQEPIVSPGVVDVGGNWEGVYLGAFIGGASGTASTDEGESFFEEDSLDISGWMVGVNAGANFYITDGIVGGIVGDIAWSDVSGEETYLGEDYGFDVNWQGSLRGKLGFDGGAFMPYLTGGLAFANGTASASISDFSESNTHIGWTVGAGVEIAATEDLSIDILYRYSDFGSQDYDGLDIDLTQHAVTAGLNWKF